MRHAFLALAAALLIACSAAPPPPSAGTPPAKAPAATPTTPGAAAPSTSPAAPAPVASAPAPASPVAAPTNPSRSCRSDADCAVKDVGNCCGYYPMCVNKDAVTDPAAVRAACASEGMAAVCGFREVQGCTCKAGVCEDVAAAGPGAEVVR
jgi:hypothetical protein